MKMIIQEFGCWQLKLIQRYIHQSTPPFYLMIICKRINSHVQIKKNKNKLKILDKILINDSGLNLSPRQHLHSSHITIHDLTLYSIQLLNLLSLLRDKSLLDMNLTTKIFQLTAYKNQWVSLEMRISIDHQLTKTPQFT